MNQADVNAHWAETILYYCEQTDPGPRYAVDASDVMTWGVDGSGNFYIDTWLLDVNVIPEPAVIGDFTGYTLADVVEFYRLKYVMPSEITGSQPWVRLTSTEISNLDALSEYTGSIIYSTTDNYPKIYSGSAWVNL
jgi:hypothetical protein